MDLNFEKVLLLLCTHIFPGGFQFGRLVAHHGVGLPCARLAISKHRAVIAIEDLLDQRRHHDGVDVALLRLGTKAAVKGELLGELGVQRVAGDHFPWSDHIHDFGRADATFPRIEGSTKDIEDICRSF